MLTELNLHKFDSLIDKCRSDFQHQIHACGNGIVQHFVYLHLMWLIPCYIAVLLYCCIQTGVLLLLFTVLLFAFYATVSFLSVCQLLNVSFHYLYDSFLCHFVPRTFRFHAVHPSMCKRSCVTCIKSGIAYKPIQIRADWLKRWMPIWVFNFCPHIIFDCECKTQRSVYKTVVIQASFVGLERYQRRHPMSNNIGL